MAFRRSRSSGFYYGLALALGLLVGMLVLAASEIAWVNSNATLSRVVLKESAQLLRRPRALVLVSRPSLSRELIIVLLAIFDFREAANRS